MKPTKLLALAALCILFGVGLCLFACQLSSNQQNEVYLPPNIYGSPLSSLWEIVLENTKVENMSATLHWFHIDIDRNRDIEHIILEFSEITDCKHCKMYHIEVNARGKVRWYSADIDNASGGMHPLTLFKELEKLNFREIPSGNDGISIDVSAISGSVGYENKCVDIYLLKNGSLIPLKKVIFESSIPWYPIEICKKEVLRSEGSKAEVEKTVTINVNESNKESQCFVVFVPQDLSKARVVEYYDYRVNTSNIKANLL